MGILETIKKNREEFKIMKADRLAKQTIAKAKAQAAYDVAYQKGAVEAVKKRAKREAMERFGYSKGERRQRALQGFTKELGALGDWGVGNRQTPYVKQSRGHKRSKKAKSRDPFGASNSDPLDMGDLDDLLF